MGDEQSRRVVLNRCFGDASRALSFSTAPVCPMALIATHAITTVKQCDNCGWAMSLKQPPLQAGNQQSQEQRRNPTST